MRRGRAAVTAMLFSACGQTVPTVPQADADARLIGRPAVEIRVCAGGSGRRVLQDSEALVISRVAAVYVGDNQIREDYGPSDPRAPVIRPLPEARASTRDRALCTARFRISDGRIAAVSYSRDGPGRASWQELCLPIVAACLAR